MNGTVSRRSILRSTTGLAGLVATGRSAAALERDRVSIRQLPTATGASRESKGFVRDWTATHVETGETRVRDVVPSLGEGEAFAIGDTSSDGSYDNRRIWVGEFDASGARWTKTLRADGHSETPRIVAFDDHYLVFWTGTTDGTDTNRVTRIDPDGNVRFQRSVDSPLFAFRDVVRTDEGYLGGRVGEISEVTSEFTEEATYDLPTPDGYDGGTKTESIVPVSDGYVATGTVTGNSTAEAFWAVKFDGTDGTIYWSEAYEFDDYVFGGTAARVGDDRVAIVGSYGEANDPIAVLVDGDGTKQWQAITSVDGVANFSDVSASDGRIRAVGSFDSDLGVVTFDESGHVLDRWHEESDDSDLFPKALHPIGDGRYLVGGDVDVSDIDTKGFLVELRPNQPPSPAVSVSPSEPNATEPVTFDASETTDPDTSVAAYEWNLDGDDYAEQTGATMTTTFDSPGTHEVTMRAVDAYGAIGKAVVSLSVGENTPPSASLSVSNAAPTLGNEVRVRATELSDAETSVESVSWAVDGEGVDATGRELAVTFDSTGEHAVAATVADTGGASTTVEASVTVAEPTATATPTQTTTATSGGSDGGTSPTGNDGGSGNGDSGDGDSGNGDSESPVPGFGVGAGALAVSAVAALAQRLGDDDAA